MKKEEASDDEGTGSNSSVSENSATTEVTVYV